VSGGERALPPFGWQQAAGHWMFAPVVTCLVAAAAALYLWGTWRVRSRHPVRPWPVWRTCLFLGGLAVIVIATQSGIGAYDDVLFWDHMVQHLLLIMVAPALLVCGQPVTLLLHASRNPLHTWVKKAVRSRLVTWLTWPPSVLALYAAVIVGTHLTGVTNAVMTNDAAHDGEHALYLIAGYLFFLPLLGHEPIRWRVSYPMRMLALIVIMPVDTFTGLVLGFAGAGLTGVASRSWGPTPVEDVHLGGAVMWIGGDALMFALAMLVFVAWSRDDRASASGFGLLESARRARLASLTGAAGTGSAGAGATAGARASSVTDAAAGSADSADSADSAGAGSGKAREHGGNIDDDDERLAAYNAYLARLNQAETSRASRPRST
jgi:cytochrome c oxidase assembly factor CtaG